MTIVGDYWQTCTTIAIYLSFWFFVSSRLLWVTLQTEFTQIEFNFEKKTGQNILLLEERKKITSSFEHPPANRWSELPALYK